MGRVTEALLLLAGTTTLAAWSAPPPGPVTINAGNRARYTHELPSGRKVAPIGRIAATPNFPTGLAIVGNRIAVLANGASRAQTITIYDARSLARISQIRAYKTPSGPDPQRARRNELVVGHQNLFQGLASGAHQMLYAAGGASNDVLAISLAGQPHVVRRYHLAWRPFPKSQYPYVYQGEHPSRADRRQGATPAAGAPGKTTPAARHFFPDALAVHGHYLFVAGMLANALARINLDTGKTRYLNIGAYPVALAFADAAGADHAGILGVALWGRNAVALVDPATMTRLATVQVGPKLSPLSTEPGMHPIALVGRSDSPHLYVALANADDVAEIDTSTRSVIRRISVRPYHGARPGSYPDGLALAGDRLFVANAGNDDVAVYDTRTGGLNGLIPTGWYPSAVAASAHDLFVVSAKGLGAGPNLAHQWVGDMMDGLLQKQALDTTAVEAAPATPAVLADDGMLKVQRRERRQKNAAMAASLRRKIHTVVLILRENKTFDEEFGGFPGLGAWAEPKLALYGRRELPNLFALAGRGALFENFDADGEVTAQGHQWTTAASSSDFVERTWGQYYSGRALQGNPGWTQPLAPAAPDHDPDNPYADLSDLAALRRPATNPWISYPYGSFLLNDLERHGVGFENFGGFIARDRHGSVDPALRAASDAGYPGWDRMLLDTDRAGVVTRWIAVHRGDLPRFIYIWLPDDHTAGAAPCYYTPDSYVANNDLATGRIVAALSRTKAWRHMLVLITEDDAQSGADHIDAHRTFLVADGPWVKHHGLVTHHYSQIDMMRTIEAILGVPAMSQWDQGASVVRGIWRKKPNDKAVAAQPMRIPLSTNPGSCRRITQLRHAAGEQGKLLTPAFIAAHPEAGRSATNGPVYGPTTLLKVSGGEQMRQEWTTSKGAASYTRVMAWLHRYAAARHAPLAAFMGSD